MGGPLNGGFIIRHRPAAAVSAPTPSPCEALFPTTLGSLPLQAHPRHALGALAAVVAPGRSAASPAAARLLLLSSLAGSIYLLALSSYCPPSPFFSFLASPPSHRFRPRLQTPPVP